jgi:hypothetical protein
MEILASLGLGFGAGKAGDRNEKFTFRNSGWLLVSLV